MNLPQTPSPLILNALAILWAVLFFASLTFFLITKILPAKDLSKIAAIIKTWWIIIFFFSLIFLLGKWYIILLLITLVLLASKEFVSVLNNNAHIVWLTVIISLCSFYFLYALPADNNLPAGGQGLLFFVIVLTQANDIFQFLWGKSLGRRKILPAISPNKTWGGFLGAIASSAGLSILTAHFFMPFNFLQALFCGALISILGFCGDITISAVKRKANVKDTGNILPGHGGILDRIDSLIYTVPLFLCYVLYSAGLRQLAF